MNAKQRKCDLHLVKLTKVRLQNLARKQSLENLALQFIAANFQLYKDFNLPSHFREKLLQRILQWRCIDRNGNLEQFDKMMQALPKLVGQLTVSVDFTNMFTFCPMENVKSSFIQVCELLAQVAPCIEELLMTSSPKLFIQNLLQPLTKMQKLQTLRLRCCRFDFDGLLELCRALPSLRVLGVNYLSYDFEDSGCGNNLSRALQHLRVLEDDNWHICRLSLFSRVAPQLDYLDVLQRDEDTTFRLQEDEDKIPSQRRKFLCLYYNAEHVDGKEELNVKHPFITCLQVYGSFMKKYGVETLDKFSNLKTLVLNSCKLTDVDNLMIVYGQNLRTLHIVDDWEIPMEGLTFGRILDSCPRLEKLCLKNVIIPDEDANPFPELRDFSWEYDGDDVVCVLLRSSILSSPKLARIKLLGKFKVEDLKDVATLIEQKKILRQLQSFHLSLVYTSNPNFNFSHCRAAVDLAKAASAFLPLLVDVRLSINDDCYISYEDVAAAITENDPDPNDELEDEALNKMIKEFEIFRGIGFKP
ncbi:Hypothetical predicted protein [Cloeon dipterum]|uniref:Uncharacterized protein n=1 Tax=Cloeon dipterum TaxID=197152 RepID=A0A8S1DWT7_9INSE|nr:Hypothetical predicted protein [Cloeon dipterum]